MSSDGRRRAAFFCDVFFLSSLRCRLPPSDIPLRMRRCLGGRHAASTRAANRSSASFLLAACVRCVSADTTTSPSLVAPTRSRALTASVQGESSI